MDNVQITRTDEDLVKELALAIKLAKVIWEEEKPGKSDILIQAMQDELEKIKTPKADNGKKKAMLSQPMAGKSKAEIKETRERAIAYLEGMGYEVVNTLFTDEWYSNEAMKARGVVQIPLCFLAKSLENMSKCHVAYFCHGWEDARGCRIEYDAAVAYGLTVIEEA